MYYLKKKKKKFKIQLDTHVSLWKYKVNFSVALNHKRKKIILCVTTIFPFYHNYFFYFFTNKLKTCVQSGQAACRLPTVLLFFNIFVHSSRGSSYSRVSIQSRSTAASSHSVLCCYIVHIILFIYSSYMYIHYSILCSRSKQSCIATRCRIDITFVVRPYQQKYACINVVTSWLCVRSVL